jgi:NAD(P)-dependent dehydrogenase (short-subunit alcohol dehydrogenase family)
MSFPKVALVTGAAHRLGRAMSVALAEDGYKLAVHYGTSKQGADDLVHFITSQGGQAKAFQASLADESQVEALIPSIVDWAGPVGVLVNNAAVFERDEALTAKRSDWDFHMEINLRAPFVLSQQMALALPPNDKGVIVNLIDQRVWNLTPHFTTYTLSKAGLWTLTQTLALALAPRIRVAAIGPGPALPSTRQTQIQFDQQAARTPLKVATSLEEIVTALRYILASPAYTGQMIALDGGQHLDWAPGDFSSVE